MPGGPRGQLNARGSQFVRGCMLIRVNGVDPTGPAIDVTANTNYIVGFTSGVPATFADSNNTRSPFTGGVSAVSGLRVPAPGLYEASAVVYVSGLSEGADLGRIRREFGIELTKDSVLLPQSVRVYPVESGIPGNPGDANATARPVVGLRTECMFDASGGETLAVVVRSNTGVGTWRLTGADTILASRMHALPAPAAVLILRRLPSTPLDSSTELS